MNFQEKKAFLKLKKISEDPKKQEFFHPSVFN